MSPPRPATAALLALLLLGQALRLGLERVAFEVQRAELAATACVNRDIPAATFDCAAACVWEATVLATAEALFDIGEDGSATVPSAPEQGAPYVATAVWQVLAKALPVSQEQTPRPLFGYRDSRARGHRTREERPPRVS